MIGYSSHILDSFSGEESTLPLDNMLRDQEKHEAYRMFVSVLILVTKLRVWVDIVPWVTGLPNLCFDHHPKIGLVNN